VADAPQPTGPAGDRMGERTRLTRESVLARGLAGIAAVTAATLGLGAAAAVIAFVISQLF
jgi:hypothetical protein